MVEIKSPLVPEKVKPVEGEEALTKKARELEEEGK